MKKSIFFVGLTALLVVLMTTFNFAKGWVEVDGIWYFERADGNRETDAILSSGEDKFYVNSNGEMARDVLLEDFNGNTYYFGSNGAMVKGTWVSVDPTALTDPGDNPPGAYYFYFGPNGAAYKAKNSDVLKKTIDGQKYLFNDKGHRLYGWVDATGIIVNDDEEPFKEALYYCGDEYDGALRSGWVQFDGGTTDDEYYDYSSIWLYFDPNSNKKIKPEAGSTGNSEKTKKIDGQTYLFDQYGVMKHGWQDVNKKNATSYTGKFYSEDYEGQLKKKSWFYTVPPEKYDNENQSYEEDDYATDTKRWFYVDNAGAISTNAMKKIDSHYYCFDNKGIMKTGLVVWDTQKNEYKYTIDTDRMESRDFISRRVGSQDGTKNYVMDTNGVSHNVLVGSSMGKYPDKIYYFYKDTDVDAKEGSRANKPVKITFTDGEFEFYSNSNGQYQGYKPRNKRIFDGGFMLKADKDIGYGLAVSTDDKPLSTTTDYSGHAYRSVCYTSYDVKLYILDSNGSKVTKANMIKKDKNDNYWITNSKGEFQKIFNVQIKYAAFSVPSKTADGGQSTGWVFKSEYKDPNKTGSTKTTFIPFGDYTFSGSICEDAYGKSCVTTRKESVSSHCNDYTVIPTGHDYALNFYWTDKASQGPYPPKE